MDFYFTVSTKLVKLAKPIIKEKKKGEEGGTNRRWKQFRNERWLYAPIIGSK